MKNQWLIKSGFLIPIIFWMTTLICGFIMSDYNHATRMVSELGEIGTETQYIFTVGLILSSLFSILFIIGLYKTCKQTGLSTIPILILFTFSFSIFGAAIFPFPLRLHGLLGMPSILLFLSPLMSLILWSPKIISNIKILSLLIFIIMSLGFLIFIPNLLTDYFGLKQRFFHFGWTIWFLYMTNIFVGLDKNKLMPAINDPAAADVHFHTKQSQNKVTDYKSAQLAANLQTSKHSPIKNKSRNTHHSSPKPPIFAQ